MADVTSQGVLSAVARNRIASGGSIAYVGKATTYNGFSSGPTVNYPTVSENDIMVAYALSNDAHNTTGTPPTGWTKILEQDPGSGGLSMFWKRAGASEPASEAWTSIFDANEASGWVVVAYSGCTTSGSPIDVSGSETGAFGTAKDISATSVTNNAMAVSAIATTQGSGYSFTWDGGITEREDVHLGTQVYITIGDEIISTAGLYSMGGDMNSATTSTEATIALKP